MTGVYGFFSWLPMWAAASLLSFLCLGILFIIRDITEKFPYNVSVSSQQGDWALIAVILMGMELVKGREFLAPWMGFKFQFFTFGVSILISVFYNIIVLWREKGKRIFPADVFHNCFIFPLLLSLLILLLPVIFLFGPFWQKLIAISLVGFWIFSFLFDVADNRLQQRPWLKRRGVYALLKMN